MNAAFMGIFDAGHHTVWADGCCTGHLTDWTSQNLGLVLDVVRRPDGVQGFQVRPGRCGFIRGGGFWRNFRDW
ncbi:hypothetical protein [Streptomyces sp. Root264]|uniref:hypothetical protein n=1 Tax=Streptomyces sp. Root264 TaxID=1736503 RepID=UPI0012FEB9E6|nr:hypothetical protein [Streptomyces sp. Root264]